MRKPFSTAERQQLIESVNSGAKICKAAKSIAKSMNRSEGSVVTKMYELKRKLGLAPKRNKKVKTPRAVVAQQPVAKNPAEIAMNFKPSRTEIHSDHVRLYF